MDWAEGFLFICFFQKTWGNGSRITYFQLTKEAAVDIGLLEMRVCGKQKADLVIISMKEQCLPHEESIAFEVGALGLWERKRTVAGCFFASNKKDDLTVLKFDVRTSVRKLSENLQYDQCVYFGGFLGGFSVPF